MVWDYAKEFFVSSVWSYGFENGRFQNEHVPDDAIRMGSEIWIALPGDKS